MLKEVETLYLRVFKNQKLPASRRHQAALNIFSFPSYYKPNTQLTMELLEQVSQLSPENPENLKLSDTFLKAFDRKQKFTFYE